MSFNDIKYDSRNRTVSFNEQVGDLSYSWRVEYLNRQMASEADYILTRIREYDDTEEEIHVVITERFYRDGNPISYSKTGGGEEFDNTRYEYENRGSKGMKVFRTWRQGGELYGGSRVKIRKEILEDKKLDPVKLRELNNFIVETNVNRELGLKPGGPMTPAVLYEEKSEGRRPREKPEETDRDASSVAINNDKRQVADDVQKPLDFGEDPNEVGRRIIS